LQPQEWIQLALKSAQRAQLQWVVKAAPAAVAGASERLVGMPAVPLEMAQVLVAAGVRISYAQLIAAANSMVAGVEVWVQAQQQLGVDSDMPSVAKEICSPYDVNMNRISVSEFMHHCSDFRAKDTQQEQGRKQLTNRACNAVSCKEPQLAAAYIQNISHALSRPMTQAASLAYRQLHSLAVTINCVLSCCVSVHAAQAAACWRHHRCAAAAGHEWQRLYDGSDSSVLQHASTA
jgi:hypothetical protein